MHLQTATLVTTLVTIFFFEPLCALTYLHYLHMLIHIKINVYTQMGV